MILVIDFMILMYDFSRVFGTSMVEEYDEAADPSERLDDQDDDLGTSWEHDIFNAVIISPLLWY